MYCIHALPGSLVYNIGNYIKRKFIIFKGNYNKYNYQYLNILLEQTFDSEKPVTLFEDVDLMNRWKDHFPNRRDCTLCSALDYKTS